uniref:Putative group v salivary lipocalin n=1 Tax=Rhipicephalus pulchellus TaxID=72859 RepID=L7MBQ0_RHIPC
MKHCFSEMHLLKVIITVATLTFFNTNAETDPPDESQLGRRVILPIVGVFNTTHLLWLYQQNIYSMRSDPRCRSDERCTVNETLCISWKKLNISNKDVDIQQERKRIKATSRVTELHGRFEKSAGGLGRVEFNITGRRQQPYKIMDLVYNDTNCSVFSVNYSTQAPLTVCELFVQDQQAPYGPTEGCSKYFNQNCTGDTLVFYNKTCSAPREELTSTQGPQNTYI